MTMEIRNAKSGVRNLVLKNIGLYDREFLFAWLYALDVLYPEHERVFRHILEKGTYSFSNIKHKVSVFCRKD